MGSMCCALVCSRGREPAGKGIWGAVLGLVRPELQGGAESVSPPVRIGSRCHVDRLVWQCLAGGPSGHTAGATHLHKFPAHPTQVPGLCVGEDSLPGDWECLQKTPASDLSRSQVGVVGGAGPGRLDRKPPAATADPSISSCVKRGGARR